MLIRWCFSDWPVSGVTLHYLDRATLNKCKCVSKHLHMNISWVKWAVRARPAPGVGLHVESAAFRGEKRLHCAAPSGSAAAGWTDGSGVVYHLGHSEAKYVSDLWRCFEANSSVCGNVKVPACVWYRGLLRNLKPWHPHEETHSLKPEGSLHSLRCFTRQKTSRQHEILN